MNNDSKFKAQLRILYSLLGILIIIVFASWITSNSRDITNDLGIWVGSMGTIIAIVVVVINTNRQINNQNKQMHRPYLSIDGIELSDVQENTEKIKIFFSEDIDNRNKGEVYRIAHSYQYSRRLENNGYRQNEIQNKFLKIKINVSNIGIGVATNIWGYDMCTEKFLTDGMVYFEDFDENQVINLTAKQGLKSEGDFTLDIILSYVLLTAGTIKSFDNAFLLVYYTDINGRIYKTMLRVDLRYNNDNTEKVFRRRNTYNVYASESSEYKRLIEQAFHINEVELDERYEKIAVKHEIE